MIISNLTSTSLKTLITLVEKKAQLAKQIESVNAQIDSFSGATSSSSNGNFRAATPPRKTRRKRMGRPKGSKNTSSAVKLPKGRPAKPTSRKGKPRGAIKEAVIAALKAGGKAGIHIADLAKKVDSSKNSLNVWLYTNRKKTKELKKLDKPGVWGWDG